MTGYGPYAVYGISLTSDHPLATPLPEASSPPEMHVHFAVGPTDWVDSHAEWEEIFRGTAEFDDGRPMFRILRKGEALLVRYSEVADFVLERDTVSVRVYAEEYVPAAEIYLLGTVLSVWLELRGALVLHGAAVASGGRALVLLGDKGAGKTTLTCGMLLRGDRLIADDLTVVRPDPMAPVPAAYPRLRLWPEQAETLFGLSDLEPILPGETKRWAPLPDPDLFAPRGAPAGAFYVLSRSAGRARVSFDPVSGPEAVMCLLRHSFVPNVAESLGLGPERLRRLADLATRTPVYTFRYGSSMEDLNEVCDALAAHVADASSGAAPG